MMQNTYSQTTIGGFKVEVFNTYDGKKLFITDASGAEIFAAKVSGNPLEWAKDIIDRHVLEAATLETKVSEMLCLSEREQEFFEAATRCAKGDLEVFEDFEMGGFVVKNFENNNEYRVRLEVSDEKVYASCECADYIYRQRICKHLSKVLAKRLTQAVFA